MNLALDLAELITGVAERVEHARVEVLALYLRLPPLFLAANPPKSAMLEYQTRLDPTWRVRRAYRIMAGITTQTGKKTSEDISGIGDRAILGAIGNMMFLKGDTSVELAGPAVLGSKDATITMARKIASRL